MRCDNFTSKLFKYVFGITTIGLFVFAGQVNAVKAYSNATPLGNQGYSGSLGLEFMVNSPIIVYSLGVYDSDAKGISGTLNSRLWERTGPSTGTALTPALSFTSGDPGSLDGNYRFKDLIVPLLLTPGTYVVSSWGYNSVDLNGNTNPANGAPFPVITGETGGGLVTYSGSSYGPVATAFPGITSSDNDPFHYAAGNFTFTAVPEPKTYLILGSLLGLTVFALSARKRPRKQPK